LLHRHESVGVIDRPVEEVWHYILDGNIWNSLRDNTFAYWVPEGPVGVGSTLVLGAQIGPLKIEAPQRIIEFKPYQTVVFELGGGWSRLIERKGSKALTRFTFERLDSASTRLSKVATGDHRWFLSPLMALETERYKRWVPMLKRAIESAPPPSTPAQSTD